MAESEPSGSEVIGLIAAMIVLLLAFGSVYAMVVPILTALFALAFGLSVVGMLSAWIPIGTSAPVVAAMIRAGRRERLRAADRDHAPGGDAHRARSG